jgi:hypothetical protein
VGKRSIALALGALCSSLMLLPSAAEADTPKPLAAGWSGRNPEVSADLRAGKPLVVQVFVPLCSDDKGGPCGKHPGAGEPRNLEDNLYWGAVFGARRYLARGDTGWKLAGTLAGEGSELERVTFKRSVSGSPWGAPGTIDVLVVLHAIDGDSGKQALEQFLDVAGRGGTVKLDDGSGPREERVHAVGFMGRNPLLKNGRVPERLELPALAGGSGIPAFTTMAHARETVAAHLHRSGSKELLLPRGPVASEGYLLDAVVQGLARNEASWSIRKRAVKSYSRWHKVPTRLSEAYFSPVPPKTWAFGARTPES